MASLNKSLFAASLLVAGASAVANAETVNMMGRVPTADELVSALTPAQLPPEIKFRGVRPTAAGPAARSEARMAAAALDIKFAFNSAQLTPEAKTVLDQLGTALQSAQLANYTFRVEGHTDAKGADDRNMALSEQRAKAVRDYLVTTYKVPAEKLEVVGKGEAQLLDPARPEDGVNRRVEVINLGR